MFDRPSFQQHFGDNQWILKRLFIFNVVVFLLQLITREAGFPYIDKFFLLSGANIKHGFIWTLISYGALHADPWHLILNSLFIYIIGLSLLHELGSRGLMRVYLFSIFAGGVIFTIFHLSSGVPCVGAQAGLAGMFALMCLLNYDRIIFPFIPIKGKTTLWIYLGIDLCYFLFYDFAHAEHLGGILGGWLYFRYFLKSYSTFGSGPSLGSGGKIRIRVPAFFKSKKSGKSKTDKKFSFSVNINSHKALRKEADRILDKINEHGFQSLTEEERKILDKAQDIMKR